ncbi:MAG: hypothetical protein PWQ24_1737 [Mesotoga sp.]|nr:hypothetical protein [Mesotoga sp.]
MTAFDAFSFGLQLAHWDRQLATLFQRKRVLQDLTLMQCKKQSPGEGNDEMRWGLSLLKNMFCVSNNPCD